MTTTTEDMICDAVREAIGDKKNFTPEFIANVFSEMKDDQQADFFNQLYFIIKRKGWGNRAVFQWRSMQRHLSGAGKQIIDDMKDHTDEGDDL